VECLIPELRHRLRSRRIAIALLLARGATIRRYCFVPVKRGIKSVFGRTIRTQNERLVSHVQVDMWVIMWRHYANAVKGDDADLDAFSAEFVEE